MRFDILFRRFRAHQSLGVSIVANDEPLLPWRRRPWGGSRAGGGSAPITVELGVSLSRIRGATVSQIQKCVTDAVAQGAHYLILFSGSGSASVVFHTNASARSVLRAKYHAQVLLEQPVSGRRTHKIWPGRASSESLQFVQALEDQGWDLSHCELGTGEWRFLW